MPPRSHVNCCLLADAAVIMDRAEDGLLPFEAHIIEHSHEADFEEWECGILRENSESEVDSVCLSGHEGAHPPADDDAVPVAPRDTNRRDEASTSSRVRRQRPAQEAESNDTAPAVEVDGYSPMLSSVGYRASPQDEAPVDSDGAPSASEPPQVVELAFTEDQLVKAFAEELRVVLNLAARLLSTRQSDVGIHAVDGGSVYAFVECYDPICTWAPFVDGAFATFCACGGVAGRGHAHNPGMAIEHVELNVVRHRSSSSRHAAALAKAMDQLAHEVGALNPVQLVAVFPGLSRNSPRGDHHGDTCVFLSFHCGKRGDVPIFLIYFKGV